MLTIELVPKGQWGSNLRSELSTKDWDTLRRESYHLASYKCEICGGVGSRHPVECHEIWHYDDAYHVQRLDGLIALCPLCHKVKHMGRTMAVGEGPRALRHIMEVNSWTDQQTEDYVSEAFLTWQNRSRHQWVLDLSWLKTKDIEVPVPK